MIVLKTEVRVSRNLKGFNFVEKLDLDSALQIESKVSDALTELGYDFKKIKDMSSLDKLDLFETVSSGDIFKNELMSGIYMSDKKPMVLLNETDHIVIQDATNGFEIDKLYDNIDKLDDFLSEKLNFAFSEEFGYLTSDPNLCGNGMNAAITLHLPATAYFGSNSLIESLNRLGYHVKTLSSDKGSVDSIMKISPDRTIGISEREYLSKLSNIAKEVVDMEEQNRKKLYFDDSVELEDIVNRAYGVLSNCRMISEVEFIEQLSDLFLGIELAILNPKKELILSDTISRFKNGRLQIETGSLLDMKSRDILRANEVRKMMKEVF